MCYGPARRYFNVISTVHVVASVSRVRTAAAEYVRKQKHFIAVCLATCDGHDSKPCEKWSRYNRLTQTQNAVQAVAYRVSDVPPNAKSSRTGRARAAALMWRELYEVGLLSITIVRPERFGTAIPVHC